MHVQCICNSYTYIFLTLVTCMLFSGLFGTDNQMVCSSLGKTVLPVLSIPYLPVALCAGLRLYGLSPICLADLLLLVQLMFRQSWW